MWNSLLKLSVVSYVWKRYRRTLIGFPLLLLYFWGVGLIHEDFIAYITLDGGKQGVAWSFIVKWLLILAGIVVFILLHLNGVVTSAHSTDNVEPPSVDDVEQDAFSRIRKKDKLRSKADVILARKKTR